MDSPYGPQTFFCLSSPNYIQGLKLLDALAVAENKGDMNILAEAAQDFSSPQFREAASLASHYNAVYCVLIIWIFSTLTILCFVLAVPLPLHSCRLTPPQSSIHSSFFTSCCLIFHFWTGQSAIWFFSCYPHLSYFLLGIYILSLPCPPRWYSICSCLFAPPRGQGSDMTFMATCQVSLR